MSYMVRIPKDRFSHDQAQIIEPFALNGQILLKLEQVAQRATIAHLRANFTFSYCKSLGDDDPQGLANLDPRGMIGRIYVGYH